ncbi:hypothetical protein D9M73_236520 [compost metagenome]
MGTTRRCSLRSSRPLPSGMMAQQMPALTTWTSWKVDSLSSSGVGSRPRLRKLRSMDWRKCMPLVSSPSGSWPRSSHCSSGWSKAKKRVSCSRPMRVEASSITSK